MARVKSQIVHVGPDRHVRTVEEWLIELSDVHARSLRIINGLEQALGALMAENARLRDSQASGLDTLTRTEAAKLIGVSEDKLATYIGTGELPAVHLGTRVLIRKVALEAFLAERERSQARD